MFWVSRVIAPLALVAGMAVTTSAVMADADGNQPPFGKGGKGFKGFPGGDDKKKGEGKKGEGKKEDKKIEEKKADEKKGQSGPKSDPVVDAWLTVLLSKLTDPHDTVRDSAGGAIVAVGAPALPALQKLADGDDPAKAVAARKLIAAIHHGHGHREPGGHPPVADHGAAPKGPGGPHAPGGHGFGPPGPGGRGPGGGPGMGPGGRGGPGDRGGERGRGPGRGGRDEEEQEEVEVAPMPRDVVNG